MNYYNTKELCDLLHISRNTVQKMRETGLLPYIKLGKGYLYTEEDIEILIKRYKGQDLTQIKSDRNILYA